jgi:hypothetical protein
MAAIFNIELCLSRRYFKYELLAKGAITKEDLPIFLSAWLDRSNSMCMFSANQQLHGPHHISQEVVGTLTVLLVSLLPLKLNLGNQGRQ